MAMATMTISGSLRSDKRALNSRMMGLCFLATLDRLPILRTSETLRKIENAERGASSALQRRSAPQRFNLPGQAAAARASTGQKATATTYSRSSRNSYWW